MKTKFEKNSNSAMPISVEPGFGERQVSFIGWFIFLFVWFLLEGCYPVESQQKMEAPLSNWMKEANLILSTQNADSLVAVSRGILNQEKNTLTVEERRSVKDFIMKAFSISEQTDSMVYLAQSICREAEYSKDTLEMARIIYQLNFEVLPAHHLKILDGWVAQSANYMAIRPDHEMAGNIFNKYGMILSIREQYEKAGNWMMKAYRFFQKKEDYMGLNQVSLNLGNIYSDLKSTGGARKYYLLALEYARQTNNPDIELSSLINLGVFYRPFRPDSAILFFNRVIQLSPAQNLYSVMAHYNLGNVYIENGDFSKAMRQFEWVKATAAQLKFHEGLVMGDLGRSMVLRKMGKYKESITIQQQSLQYADSVQFGYLKTRISENLEDTYAGMGDYQNAYQMLKSIQAHKDSVLNIDKQMAIHELELFYVAEQQKLEQQNLAATLANQKLVGWFRWAMASMVILLLAFLSVHYYKRNKERVLEIKKLEERNNLLAELEQVKTQQAEFLEHIVEQQKIELLTISQENEIIRKGFTSGNFQQSMLSEKGMEQGTALGNPLYWENLAIKFNLIFPGFVENLKENYPRLSPADIQFCMLLKLNIPLKDIASILNITLQGVYKKKYRMEEKMGIDSAKDDANQLMQLLK